MSLTKQDIINTANLSRLELSDADDQAVEKLTSDINNIMELIGQIDSVTTDDIDPMAHPHATSTRTRDDKVTEPNLREQMQECVSPEHKEAGLYLVPKVIEES